MTAALVVLRKRLNIFWTARYWNQRAEPYL